MMASQSAYQATQPAVLAPRAQASTPLDAPPAPASEAPTTIRRPVRADARTVVVVGNGMVGFKFCQRLAALDPEGALRLVVFGEEPRPAYDRVNLTDYFSTKSAEDLLLAGAAWYAQQSIELVTGQRVVRIDRENRQVVTEAGRRVSYDELVLATGSYPFVPPIEGADHPRVFVYRTIEDLEAIRAACQGVDEAAVIGGGLLGIEAARALSDLQVRPTIIEASNALMPQQLDMQSGEVLCRRVEAMGVTVRRNARTRRIEPADGGLRLHFEEGEPLDTGLVIIATGVRPRDELALEAGLDVPDRGKGVIINDELRTSDPRIHAVGECARHNGVVYGLVAPGYEMADVLARRLCGDETARFAGGDLSARLKLAGTTVAVFGEYHGDPQTMTYEADGVRRSLMVRAQALVGARIVGDWDQISMIQEAVVTQRRITTREIERFHKTGDLFRKTESSLSLSIANWPEKRLVCNCLKIDRGTLTAAMCNGACDVESLKQCTGAGTVCGSCQPLLAALVGAPAAAVAVKGRRLLYAVSLMALVAAALMVALGPIPYAESFDGLWYRVSKIWQVGWIKQTTGFTLLGVSVLGLVLSLRKRVKWLKKLGDFGWYRVFHTAIGLLCLAGLVVHTGMHMGSNLNFALMCVFLTLNVLGAVAGVTAAVEARSDGRWALVARRWRPWLTWAHILLFWPLPVLVGFHIASVYLY